MSGLTEHSETRVENHEMARRIVNRKEKRAEVEAFERRKDEGEEETEEEEEEGDEDDDEGEEDEEGEAAEPADDDEEAEAGDDDDDDEDAPKKKKKVKPKPVAKPKAKPRSRAVKVVRMRVVWGVFNNSHQMVATYEYPKKSDADARAAQLTTEKRNTHFVQPVKEPIVEEKDPDKPDKPEKPEKKK
jgi:hypothetical protein